MKRYGKVFFMAVLAAAMAVIFAGCGNSQKLAEDFDKDSVIEQAKQDITTAEANDYEGWKARFSEALQEGVTEDAYAQYLAILKEKGDFEEFGKAAVTGLNQNGADYAVVIYVVKHAEGDIQYTIIYDKDMNLMTFTM